MALWHKQQSPPPPREARDDRAAKRDVKKIVRVEDSQKNMQRKPFEGEE